MPTTEIENFKNPSKIHPNPENTTTIINNTPKNFKAFIMIISAYFGITFSFQWSLTLLDNINFAKLENFFPIVKNQIEYFAYHDTAIIFYKQNNFKMAKKIVTNAKMRRTSICGALETLLIEEKAINSHGVGIIKELINRGCEVRVDNKINKFFKNKLTLAKELDWQTEYLEAIISVKTVKNVKDAVSHVLKYGTMHTDGIISNNKKNTEYFLNKINSSIAMHNVSTQFADGGEFGFGGEIGISTNKLPPRGPIGIDQLTSYKYIVSGRGVTRP